MDLYHIYPATNYEYVGVTVTACGSSVSTESPSLIFGAIGSSSDFFLR